MAVYCGPALKPQPNHPPEVLARIVRVPVGAALLDPLNPPDKLRSGTLYFGTKAPVLPDPPGERSPVQAGGVLTFTMKRVLAVSEDGQARTVDELVAAIGSARTVTASAVHKLADKGTLTYRVHGRRRDYWLTGLPEPAIDPADQRFPLTARLLSLLASGGVYTVHKAMDACNTDIESVQNSLSYLRKFKRIQTRRCCHAGGILAQCRLPIEAPWPPLPAGWRTLPEDL